MLNKNKKSKNKNLESQVTMNESLLLMMEQTKDLIAAFAGVKAQAVEAGFSEQAAELIVLEMVKNASKG